MCSTDQSAEQTGSFGARIIKSPDKETSALTLSNLEQNYQSAKRLELMRSRKSTLTRPPSSEECIADQFNYAILKGCLCYLFQSTGQSNGSFQSPQIDFLQSKQVTCLLFTYVGDLNEIVRLEFTHFLLDPQEHSVQDFSSCRSYVRIFDSLERAELNQNDRENFKICGSEKNLPQRVFYSAGRVLIMEVHLSWQYSRPMDLRGLFKFESKDWYQSSGTPIAQSVCDRIFVSPETSVTRLHKRLLNVIKREKYGVIFSPRFPGNYPVNTTCMYYFIGTKKERVSIALTDVRLNSPDNCASSESHDRIEVHELDINLRLFKMGSIDPHTKDKIAASRPIAVVCGKVSHTHIISDGPTLTLRFVAHDGNNIGGVWGGSSGGGYGFRGRFEFMAADQTQLPSGPTRLTTRQFGSKYQVADQSEQLTNLDQSMRVEHISPGSHKLSGVVESPNYPRPYPENLQMLYVFHIPSEMLVRIKFSDFRLDNRSSHSCISSEADRLEVYDGPYPQTEKMLVLCGSELQAHLFQKYATYGELISSGELFTLRFVSDGFRYGQERGFVFSYEYIPRHLSSNSKSTSLLDVTETKYSQNSSWTSEGQADCQYTISSNGKDDVGHIWIGRYVNAIPGNGVTSERGKLPNCRWRLQGKPGQRIRLKVVKKTTSQIPTYMSEKSRFLQHDEQFQLESSAAQSKPLSTHDDQTTTYLNSLKCNTPVSVEFVNYRSVLVQSDQEFKRMDDLAKERKFGNFKSFTSDSTSPLDDTAISSSFYSDRGVEPSDPIRLCADGSVGQSPAAQGFMSGTVPQLDVILRLDMPVFDDQTQGTPWKHLFENLNLDYDIQYRFVTDFGVVAPFGYQRKPGCFFEFNRSQSLKGNFSSPNYPGLYPIDLICEYRFSGTNVRKIEIEFLAFDVESASKSCTDDRLGDYVELRSCFPMELSSYPKRRLCHKQNDKNPYRVEWFEPCLILRFFSNEVFVTTGFLGQYEFHIFGNGTRVSCQPLYWITIFILFIKICLN